MIWPPYMTLTRLHELATTPRSWVIRMIAVFVRSFKSFNSLSTCAWIVTSRAVVGSSAIRSSGRQDNAMAIMALWRIPPENSWG